MLSILTTKTKPTAQEHEETFGGDAHVCYFDCDDSFMKRCLRMFRLVKLYMLSMYSFWYIISSLMLI